MFPDRFSPTQSESSFEESIEDDGCSQRPAVMDTCDVHNRRTLFLGGWQSPLPPGHANITTSNRTDLDPGVDINIIIDPLEPRVDESQPVTRKRLRTRLNVVSEVSETTTSISQPTSGIIYEDIEVRRKMPDITPINNNSIRYRTRRARRLAREEPERDMIAVELPHINADSEDIREALETHRREFGSIKRPKNYQSENFNLIEFLQNGERSAFDELMHPTTTSKNSPLASKKITKYKNMSDNQIKSHLTSKISKKIEKTIVKKRKKNEEECIYPLTLEDFRKENDPSKKKKVEKASANKEFRTKSIKSFFQFNDPTLDRTETIPQQQFITRAGLRIYAVNAQGSIMKKIDDLLFDMTGHDIDVTCVTDTGLTVALFKPQKLTSLCLRHNYRVISGPYLDKQENKNSHICMIVKRTLDLKEENILKCGRAITLEIPTVTKAIRIMGVYQGFLAENNKKLQKEVKNWCQQSPDNSVVMGDFNEISSRKDAWSVHADGAKEHNVHRHRGEMHKTLTSLGLVDSFHFFETSEPAWTHVQATPNGGKSYARLDYIYVSGRLTDELVRYQTHYGSAVNSDHTPISAEFDLSPETREAKTISPSFNVRCTNKTKWENYSKEENNKMSTILENIMSYERNIEGLERLLSDWQAAITTSAKTHLPSDGAPIENSYTLALRDDELVQEYKKDLIQKNHEWRMNGKKDKTDYIKACKTLKERRQIVIHAQNEKQWKITEEKIRENSSHIFKMLRKTGKRANRKSERPYIVEKNGKLTTDPQVVKETFHGAWEKIYGNVTEAKTLGPWLEYVKRDDFDDFLRVTIDMPILEEKLKNLNTETAPGTDEIHNIFLKKLSTAGKEILISIINRVILQGHVPKSWRSSVTAMLYKSEEKSNPLNYRPITLLSCAYKIYSSIQTDRLNKWIDENKILNDNQFGFRAGRDTADAAARLFACISNSIALIFVNIILKLYAVNGVPIPPKKLTVDDLPDVPNKKRRTARVNTI
jgi:exonuclease III